MNSGLSPPNYLKATNFKNQIKKMKTIISTLLLILFFTSCKKNKDTCNQYTGNKFGFKNYELILDSLMESDTVYTENNIFFKANENYGNIKWKIGEDSREFTTPSVNLRFTDPDVVNISIKGLTYNQHCNTEEKSYLGMLVVLPNDGSKISPLTGKYNGYNVDKPIDTFTVSIKYWFGQRYNWWSLGAYSIDNLPKKYIDSTQNWNGYQRPEIRGIIASTGYRNIAIDKSGNLPALGIKGYGTLRSGVKDSLIFYYSIIDTALLNRTGQLIYLQKKFIGLKN